MVHGDQPGAGVFRSDQAEFSGQVGELLVAPAGLAVGVLSSPACAFGQGVGGLMYEAS